jgi:CheY-like chemotaxis protein
MEKSYGLIVDKVQYQEEVVIKPLNEFLESFKIFTGMTILSTGKVCFILDTHSLASKGEIQYSEIVSISDKSSKSFSNESYFVFENCPNERYAIPIGQVEMIHQFKVSELARCGHDYFVDFDGKEYKVVDLANYVPSRAKNIFEEDDNIYIVRLKGLICDWVLGCKNLIGRKDYENNLQFLSTDCEVIVGQLIKGQTVTSFLDIISIDLKRSAIKVNGSEEVLIVDDSRVVRNMMSQIFKSHGYKPITAENGSQAIQILKSTEVSIIFSDLEMPGMNGFEMAVEIKEKDLSKATLVAFSSFKSDEFKSKAFESGYDHFLVKYDHENLLKYLEKDSA